MDGAYSKYGWRRELHILFWWRKARKRNLLEDLGVDGGIILQ